jgi:WD40 repeat protein
LRLLFTADGKRVVAGGASVVRVWDVEGREELWTTSHSFYSGGPSGTFDWRSDEGKLSGVDVSADGKLLATAEMSGTVRLKDAATGKDLWASQGIGKRRQRYPALGVAFHPNGKWLATRAGADRIDLWDVRTGVHLTTTGGHSWAGFGVEYTNGAAFSPDGHYLATLGQDRWLEVFDVKRLRPVGGIAVLGTPNGFGFTADGRYIVTGSVPSVPSFTIIEFTPGPRAHLRFVRTGSKNQWSGGAICIDPRAPARIVCAGGQLVTKGEDIATQKRVTYGNGTAATAVRLGDTPYDAPHQIALAADANRLVSSSSKQARVYDLKTGKQPVKLEGDGPAYSVAITSDGKRIATGERIGHGGVEPRLLRVWDGETGKLKFKLEFGDESGCPPVFSPDGKLIALGYGGDVVIVGVATQKEVNRVSGHRGATTRVAFSPDGKRLASCGDDGQTLLWDVAALTPKP